MVFKCVDTNKNMNIEIKKSSKNSDDVWEFFNKISDVTNLNPAEEKGKAFECIHRNMVVGMVVVDTFPKDYVTISRIAVDEEYRRFGVGESLLSHLTQIYDVLRSEVNKTNYKSQKLFEEFGFERIGEGRYNKLIKYEYSN